MASKRFIGSLLASVLVCSSAAAFTVDWVDVGNAGNPGFSRCTVYSCPETVGRVLYDYRISSSEVTNAQYAEFLNAVADEDTHGLYDPGMGDLAALGGIEQSGSPGAFFYSPVIGRENMPVNHVSFFEAIRFANWLQNGQSSGPQDPSTTEDGAYTITEQGILDNSIVRNPSALVFVPTQNEWIKAGFYEPVSSTYFVYSTSSNTEPVCAAPSALPNQLNCGNAAGDLTDVRSYPASTSPHGTYDQAGNVFEWTDRPYGIGQFIQGGSFNQTPEFASSAGGLPAGADAKASWIGFRVAGVVPEPALGTLVATGVLGLIALRARSRPRRLRRRVGCGSPDGR